MGVFIKPQKVPTVKEEPTVRGQTRRIGPIWLLLARPKPNASRFLVNFF